MESDIIKISHLNKSFGEVKAVNDLSFRSGEHCAKLLKDLLKTVGTVRISFYFYNTFDEIDTLYEALKNGGDFLDAYFN